MLSFHSGSAARTEELGKCSWRPFLPLSTWSLPFDGYNGKDDDAKKGQQKVVEGIESRHTVSFDRPEYRQLVLDSADAPVALFCTFAAVGVTKSRLPDELPFDTAKLEGWIAVHR